jgi:hypothetical protein
MNLKFLRESTRLLNRKGGEKQGTIWEVVLINAGLSENGVFYSPEVLIAAKDLFENSKCFAYEFSGRDWQKQYDHLPRQVRSEFPKGFVKNLVGEFKNVRFQSYDWDGVKQEGLIADFYCLAQWFRELLLNAWEAGTPDAIGFSIDAVGRSMPVYAEGQMIEKLTRFTEVREVTAVSHPAAGGKLVRLVASVINKTGNGGNMDLKTKLFALIGKLKPSLTEGKKVEQVTDEVLSENLLNLIDEVEKSKQEGSADIAVALKGIANMLKDGQVDNATTAIDALVAKLEKYPYPAPATASKKTEPTAEPKKESQTPSAPPVPATLPKEVTEGLNELKSLKKDFEVAQQSLKEMKESARQSRVLLQIEQANLPVPVKQKLQKRVLILQESDVAEIIKEEQAVMAALVEQIGKGLAVTKMEILESQRDKFQKGMDALLMGVESEGGVPAFRGLRHAFAEITGRRGDFDARVILAESSRYIPHFIDREVKESLKTSDWAQILGDSIRRVMIKQYLLDDLNTWRKIVSEFSNITDFRENHRMRMGGYGLLPDVGEGDTYQSLTSPTDEEATFKIKKKGGLEDLTFEMITNDDVKAVKEIPVKLGRAAILTLFRAVWDIIRDNPNIYDGNPLFDAVNHSNLLTDVLSHDAVSAVRKAMRKQKPYGMSEEYLAIANAPRYLLIPSDLEDIAFQLCRSAVIVTTDRNATVPNINVSEKLDYIIVPYWVDEKDWAAVADPAKMPTIEVGFLNGQQNPELFVQDVPTVGSVFTADKISYKIRHIWGVVVLDYRGFHKNVVL